MDECGSLSSLRRVRLKTLRFVDCGRVSRPQRPYFPYRKFTVYTEPYLGEFLAQSMPSEFRFTSDSVHCHQNSLALLPLTMAAMYDLHESVQRLGDHLCLLT